MVEEKTNLTKPKRRGWQFSLRTLLVLTLLIAIFFGWLAHGLNRARRQRNAVEALGSAIDYIEYDPERSGFTPNPQRMRRWNEWHREILGDDFFDRVTLLELEHPKTTARDFETFIAYLDGLSSIETLGLAGPFVTDESLGKIDFKKLPRLKVLYLGIADVEGPGLRYLEEIDTLRELHISMVDDAKLEFVENLLQLEELEIRGEQVSDLGMKHLGKFKRLKVLALSGTNVTDDGLAVLGKLTSLEELIFLGMSNIRQPDIQGPGLGSLKGTASLRRLYLGQCKIDDSGLVFLKDFRQLEDLTLDGTLVTDAGLKHLSQLNRLKKLSLSVTDVTDEGLTIIVKLTSLEELELSRTQVTATGLSSLLRLPSLKKIRARDLNLTQEELASIRQAMPDCQIDF